jgi:hypothetical protein
MEKDFSCQFDGRNYTIPAKGKLALTKEVAEHISFHLAKRILMDKLLATEKQFSRADAKALAATFVRPLNDEPVKEAVAKESKTTVHKKEEVVE